MVQVGDVVQLKRLDWAVDWIGVSEVDALDSRVDESHAAHVARVDISKNEAVFHEVLFSLSQSFSVLTIKLC